MARYREGQEMASSSHILIHANILLAALDQPHRIDACCLSTRLPLVNWNEAVRRASAGRG